MRNKKGVIRTLEAIIAIIILFIFIYSVAPQEFRNLGFRKSESVSAVHTKILDTILKDENVKDCILDSPLAKKTASNGECFIMSGSGTYEAPDGMTKIDELSTKNPPSPLPPTPPPSCTDFENKVKEIVYESGKIGILPPSFQYIFAVHNAEDNCVPKGLPPVQIFTRSVILTNSATPTTTTQTPKITRIWVWSGI